MFWYSIINLNLYTVNLNDQVPLLDSFDPKDTKNRRLMHVSEALELMSYL